MRIGTRVQAALLLNGLLATSIALFGTYQLDSMRARLATIGDASARAASARIIAMHIRSIPLDGGGPSLELRSSSISLAPLGDIIALVDELRHDRDASGPPIRDDLELISSWARSSIQDQTLAAVPDTVRFAAQTIMNRLDDAIKQQKQNAEGFIRQNVWLIIFMTMCAVMASFLLITYISIFTISKPLKRLNKYLSNLCGGNYQSEIRPERRRDEVGELWHVALHFRDVLVEQDRAQGRAEGRARPAYSATA